MTLSGLFEKLGAPLNNPRWSWGSVRDSDGMIFLRVWQDGSQKIGEKRYIWVFDESLQSSNLGADERLRHTRLLQAGCPCYLVMCEAVDTSAIVRVVRGFNKNEVFEAGEILLFEGAYWLELKGRVPAAGLFI
ncbi:hypothetical protein [Pseudomonas sp. AU10]